MTLLGPAIQGLSVGLGLILAIGAQNAFVLRQGIKREHVAVAVAVCALSDSVLISLGAAGVGTFIAETPVLRAGTVWASSAFLIIFGALALRTALTRADFELSHQARTTAGPASVAAAAVGLSLMNPHAWLDTVVILGSVAGGYATQAARIAFTGGAIAASLVFFLALGYGAAKLAPVFERPLAWKLLDVTVAVVMWSVAASLLVPKLTG